MGKYKRTTIEAEALEGLRPELAEAARNILRAMGMAALEKEMAPFIQTTSERINPGLLNRLLGDPLHYCAVGLSRDWILISRSYSKTGALPVLLARLTQIRIATRESHSPLDQMAVYPEEDGVTIHGLIGDSAERTSFLIPLGSEPAAQRFKERLKRAIAEAK